MLKKTSMTQQTFTCSKSLIETLGKYIKYEESLLQRYQNDVTDWGWRLLLAKFHISSCIAKPRRESYTDLLK